MSNERIGSALTPEEWAKIAGRAMSNQALVRENFGNDMPNSPAEWHKLAALALHGQPFGFTHEDVSMIRRVATDVLSVDRTKGRSNRLNALADRIATLLPSELR